MGDSIDSQHDITERLLELEKQEGFFDITVEGMPVWERRRNNLDRKIAREHGLVGQAHSNTTDSRWSSYAEIIHSILANTVRHNPYFASQHDVLVWGHQRRKQVEDGHWWDIYTDPIYQQLTLDKLHVEKRYLGEHLRPAPTDEIRHIEFIRGLAKVWRKLGRRPSKVPDVELDAVRDLEAIINREFEVDFELTQSVRRAVAIEEPLRRLYRRFLRRVDPNLVLVVVSYGKEPFVMACKQLGIPVVELQHGVIYPEHLAYSYPGDRIKKSFPDYLLVWGEFWREHTEFPIPDERVIPVGYPYLDQRAERYADVESEDKLLFISQGTIGEQLSKLALEVANHPEIDHEVVYKLHPGEYDRWREAYPWLVDADFRVVDSSEPPLYQLFAESSAQVGVGSTAVYEGLCFDLETYVYDCLGTHVLQPLVEDGSAEIVSSTDTLVERLGTGDARFERERYFAPNAIERTAEVLGSLAKGDDVADLSDGVGS
jgi:hypothetical protein